jgi:hypothetical protein
VNPIKWIKDTWWLIWHKDFTLMESEYLTVLLTVSRWDGSTGATVITSRPSWSSFAMIFRAYEVPELSAEGHDQLVRLLELPGGPNHGQITVWLWHQGVSQPVDTWAGDHPKFPRFMMEEP